jgi:hypothetical protein
MARSDRPLKQQTPDLGSIRPMVRDLDHEQVADEFTDLVLPESSDIPVDPTERRFILEAGLFDIVVEQALSDLPTDEGRLNRLEDAVRSVESLIPVTRYAWFDGSKETRKREMSTRMYRREIDQTEKWMLPRLERDIEAYRARIVALRAAIKGQDV